MPGFYDPAVASASQAIPAAPFAEHRLLPESNFRHMLALQSGEREDVIALIPIGQRSARSKVSLKCIFSPPMPKDVELGMWGSGRAGFARPGAEERVGAELQ
ncbi:MAG: hypothetical protein WCG81_06375 [Candidatus Angelobacter sp.]